MAQLPEHTNKETKKNRNRGATSERLAQPTSGGLKIFDHENMPIWFWPPETRLLYIFFLNQHRLWILIRNRLTEAVLTSTHNLCFE